MVVSLVFNKEASFTPMQTPEEMFSQPETIKLLESFTARRTRRAMLKGTSAVVGGGIAAVVSAGLLPASAHSWSNISSSSATVDSIKSILTVARTAEQLAITFYSNGVKNADALGLTGDNLENIKAALVEEQIHQLFFTAGGGESLADTFSFPEGAKTFTDLQTFIATQQILEGVFDSAFLAAIFEFAQMGRPDLAQVSGQIACIEAEHRALGRGIAGLIPADNWAFTPILVATVGDAPALVKKAGFLSPTADNTYTYQQVSIDDPGVEQRKPFKVGGSTVGNG